MKSVQSVVNDFRVFADKNKSAMNTVLINRRPVVDNNVTVHAYESGIATTTFRTRNAPITNNSRTIVSTISEHLDDIAGNGAVLITLPYDSIAAKAYAGLPKERVIFRFLDCRSNDETSRSLAKLAGEGYRLALSETNDNLHPAASLAEIMHLDFKRLGRHGLPRRVEQLRKFKARLLVDNIDAYEEFELCKALGIDLFQGRFFLMPNSTSHDVPASRMAVVQLMAALQEPDIRLRELEGIIGQNFSLSYKLLRFANSAYVGLRRSVDSINHAVGLVGVERIQNWASLLLFSTIDSKPRELFNTAAIRAKMCEQLSDSEDRRRKAVFFTAGLLSVLDAVLDRPMEQALDGLSLSAELRDALIDHAGALGEALDIVLAYEQSKWEGPELSRLDKAGLSNSYLESLGWWRTVSNSLIA